MVPAYTAISVPVKLNKEFKTSYLLITEPKCLKHLSNDLAILPLFYPWIWTPTICVVIYTSATPVIVPAGSLIALAEYIPLSYVLDFEECLDMTDNLKENETNHIINWTWNSVNYLRQKNN